MEQLVFNVIEVQTWKWEAAENL